MKFGNKRGETMLLKKIINTMIAIFCIILLFYGISKFSSLLFGNDDLYQADAQVRDLIETMDSLEDAEEPYLVLIPTSWLLTSYSKTSAESPEMCWSRNCLCICPAKRSLWLIGKKYADCEKGKCWQIEKEVKIDEPIEIPKEISIQIIESIVNVKVKAEFKSEKYAPPAEEEKSPDVKKIDDFLKEKYSSYGEFNLGSCIVEAEKNTGIPRDLILAVSLHESNEGKNSACIRTNNIFNIKGIGTAGFEELNTWECYTKIQKESSEKVVSCDEQEKCSCKNPPNDECKEKYYCRVWQNFKKYNDKCESINDFARLISTSSKYKNSLRYKDNVEEMIKNLGPYATDVRWVESVTNKYNEIRGNV